MYNRNHNAAKQFKKHSVEKQKKKEDRIMMKKLLANYNRSLHTKPSIFEGSRSQMKKKNVEKKSCYCRIYEIKTIIVKMATTTILSLIQEK